MTPGTNTSIGVTWTPVPGATGYKVHWGTTPGTDAAGSPATVSSYASYNYSITGLTGGTTYYITVRSATNAANPNGLNSSSGSATTQANGTTTSINYSAGFPKSGLTASAAYDPVSNLVFNSEEYTTQTANIDTSTGPYVTGGGRWELTTGAGIDQGWGTFNRTLVNVDQFTTDFTVQLSSEGDGPQGVFNFVLNSDSPINTGDNDSYSTHNSQLALMGQSIAVGFTSSNPDTGVANAIQLGINGQMGGNTFSLNNSGVSLHNASNYAIHIAYDGSVLIATITDLATMESATAQFSINIPAILGGGRAYAGLTGDSAQVGQASRNDALAWSYASSGTYTAPSPNSPTLTNGSVGSPSHAGAANYSGGTYNLSGTNYWGTTTTDNFDYDYTNWTGDGTLIAEVTAQSNSAQYLEPKPGQVVFRELQFPCRVEHTSPSQRHCCGHGIQFTYRTALNGTATSVTRLQLWC